MIQAGRPGAGVAGASPRPSKPEPRSIGTDEAGGDGAVLLLRVLSPCGSIRMMFEITIGRSDNHDWTLS